MKYKLEVCCIYEQGKRENQEDWIYPAKGKESPNDRLFILCDGMGGHEAGEVASQTVCEAMSQYILRECPNAGDDFSDEVLQGAIQAAFDALDQKTSDEKPQSKKMGTTMTCLKLHPKGYTIAHMGDSRVYHFRPTKEESKAEIVYVTRDHSLINDLITIGELTEEEAKHSKQKNVITRAMQPQMERRPSAEIYHSENVETGDYFMLCSDGMLEVLTNENFCVQFQLPGDAKKKAANLLKAINDVTQDNHSAIIVHVVKVLDDSETEETVKQETEIIVDENSFVEVLKKWGKKLVSIFIPPLEVAPDTEQGEKNETNEENVSCGVSDAVDGSDFVRLHGERGQEELHKNEESMHNL